MAWKNLLVNGKNKVTAGQNAISNIQRLKNTASNPVNTTTPNLPITTTKAANPLLKATATIPAITPVANSTPGITTNNPAFNNWQLIDQNNQPSRFIGFQQPKTDLAWNVIQNNNTTPTNTNKQVIEIPSQTKQYQDYNNQKRKEYRTNEDLLKKFHRAIKDHNYNMTAQDIVNEFPEWKDKVDAALQLQADLTPLVQEWKYADMKALATSYPEFLQQNKVYDLDKIKAKQEEYWNMLQNIKKRWEKLSKGYNTLSTQWQKKIDDYIQLANYIDFLKSNYDFKGNPTDYDILVYTYQHPDQFPQVQHLIDEINGIQYTEMDKAAIGRNSKSFFQNIKADVQETISEISNAYQENVQQPLNDIIETWEWNRRFWTNNLSQWLQSVAKIWTNIVWWALWWTSKINTAFTRITEWQDRGLNELAKDAIKWGWGALEIGFNATPMVAATALFEAANETAAWQQITDETFWLFQEWISNILDWTLAESAWLSKDTYLASWYNSLDDETKADLTNEILVAVLHKWGKVLKEWKLELEVAADAISDAFQKGKWGAMFQSWIEKWLADENWNLTKWAKGRIIKEWFNEFKEALKTNFRMYDTVLKNRRWDITANMNTLPDNRTPVEKAKSNLNQVREMAQEKINTAKEWINKWVDYIKDKITGEKTKATTPEVEKAWELWVKEEVETTTPKEESNIKETKTWWTLSEKVYDKLTWLDEATKERMKSNPYSAEENKNLIDTMESDTAFDFNEYQTNRYQNVLDTIVDKLEQKENTRKNEVWPLYQKLEETNAPIDTTSIKNQSTKFRDRLDENDWIISSSEQTKINKILDAIDTLWDWTTDIWKIRRMADQRAKWDNESTTDWIRLIREIRDSIDDEIRVQRPEMKEVDTQYRKIKDEIADLRGKLINKKSWLLRENAVSTVKNLLNPTNKQYLDRIEKEIPGITKQLQAIRDSKFVYNAYQTWNWSRFISWIARGTLWNMFKAVWVVTWWLPGLLFWAILDKAVDTALVSLTRKALKETITEMTPKAQAELESIMKKVQEWKELTAKEKAKLKEIENKIVENAENAKKTKAEQEAWDNFLNKVKKDAKSLKLPDKWGTDGGKNILTNWKTIITDEQGNSKVKGQISEIDNRPTKSETPKEQPKEEKPKNKVTNKTPKKKTETKPVEKKQEIVEERTDLKAALWNKFYDYLQKQVDIINENRKDNWKQPISIEDLDLSSATYAIDFERLAREELAEARAKLDKFEFMKADAKLTSKQQAQLQSAKSVKEKAQLLEKWRAEWLKKHWATDSEIWQIEAVLEEINDIIRQHQKTRNFLLAVSEEKNDMLNRKYYEEKAAVDMYNEEQAQTNALIQLYEQMNAKDNALVDLFWEMEAEEKFMKAIEENETPQSIKAIEEELDYLDNLLQNETPQIAEEETPKNKVTAKTPEKPKDLVTNPEFQTLPDNIHVLTEAKKTWPKRIAPDRVAWQQLTYKEWMKKVMEWINVIVDSMKASKEYRESAWFGEDVRRELRRKADQLATEAGKVVYRQWLYKSTKWKEFVNLYKEIHANTNNPSELVKIWEHFYQHKVRSDIRRWYMYPQEVIDKIPYAQWAVDSRAKYQKWLDTAFSAKDERIDYSAKDKIWAWMKRQDWKKLTEEQKEKIVKMVMWFQKMFGINMKKMAEKLWMVYVDVNGKNVFMSNAAWMFRREFNDDWTLKNASVSIGGTEKVRYKDTETWEWKTKQIDNIGEHELGHVVDYILENKLFTWDDLGALHRTYKKTRRWDWYAKYLAKDREVTARVFEQFADEAKWGSNYHDQEWYWSKEDFENVVKPILEKNLKNKLWDWYIDPETIKLQKVTSNAKNKITSLMNESESPISLKAQKELANRLMKTWLAKDVVFVDSLKDFYNYLEWTTDQPRYQSVWHGSRNSFSKFDSSHMWEWEWNQAHWWGHYVAVNRKTWEHYAEMRPSDWNQLKYNWKDIDFDWPEWDIAWRLQEQLEYDSLENAKKNVKEELEMERDEYKEEWDKEMVKETEKKIKMLDNFWFDKGKNLYEVEIPDQRKANTPTGSNYLEENPHSSDSNFMKAFITDEQQLEFSRLLSREDKDAWRKFSNRISRLYANKNMVGRDLYKELSSALWSDKAASKFLNKIWYDWIHYFWGSDWEAYVIFNDDTPTIVEHIQYLKDNNWDIAWATLPDGTVMLIKNNLRADTLPHEFSHLLRSYAKENSPELFNAINKIANEAPQALKDYVKQTYGDISEDAYLDEVFAWRQWRHSAVKWAETWYQKMWNAIKELWNKIKSKFWKEYADLSVFDAWEKMNSEELMNKVDTLLKWEKEIWKWKGSDRYEIAEQTRDNQGNAVAPQMENYMKKSVARVDEKLDAPLVQVYHTTTNQMIPFSEFNPVGTRWYRFRDNVVNYFTDDQEMSWSYADQNYSEYEGKWEIRTMEDVKNYLKELKDKWAVELRSGLKMEYSLKKNDDWYTIWNKWNEEMVKDIEKLRDEANLTKEDKEILEWVYEAWSIWDYWRKVLWDRYYDSGTDWEFGEIKEKYFAAEKKIVDTAQKRWTPMGKKYWLSSFYKTLFDHRKNPEWFDTWMSFKSEEELIRWIENQIIAKLRWERNWQYGWYVNLENPFIIDAEWRDWDTVRLNSDTLANETINKWIKLWEERQQQIKQIIKDAQKEYDEWIEEEWWDWNWYAEYNSDYWMAIWDILPDKVQQELADSIRGINNDTIEEINDIILNDLPKDSVVHMMNKLDVWNNDTTNDVVWSIINRNWELNEENEIDGTHNKLYDWVIIKNVKDYWGEAENRRPHNLYITFNSNQFKSKYNNFPTSDPDIRYNKSNSKVDSEWKKLSPEQQIYFADSKVRDADWNLLRVYHGTMAWDFTIYEKWKNWMSNSLAKVWYWFTPNKEWALNFAKESWRWKNEARADEVYLNLTNPKIYEPSKINLMSEEERKVELDKQWDIYEKKKQKADAKDYTKAYWFFHDEYDHPFDERHLFATLSSNYEYAKKYNWKLWEYNPESMRWYSDKHWLDHDKIVKDVEEYEKLKEEAEKEYNKYYEMKINDPYEDFMYDIYKIDSNIDTKWTKKDLNMALNSYESPNKFVEKLKAEWYDGIIIKWTEYDWNVIWWWARNDQYVVFDSNQIKRITNENPTENPDIRYQKNNVLANWKNKVTSKAVKVNKPEIRMDIDEREKKNEPVKYWSRKWLKKVWESSDFWPAFEWIKWQDAIDFLLAYRDGEVRWAYEYNWEPIDLVWGKTNAETNEKWFWLSKIEEKHKWVLKKLHLLLTKTKWVEDKNGIITYDNWQERAIIMPNYDKIKKKWILNAYLHDNRFTKK